MFDLLGWEVSLSEKKRMGFDRKFVSLGIQIDFSDTMGPWRVRDVASCESWVALNTGTAFFQHCRASRVALGRGALRGAPRTPKTGSSEWQINLAGWMLLRR